jgi:uncharacterized damage-inducible protein DinB
MSDLRTTLSTTLTAHFGRNLARIHELAAPLTEEQFWQKPFPFGNSFGHLVLHLTGNLSYYIGAQIAQTGYVRDRPREFSDPNPPSKEEALKKLDEAVAIVLATIHAQSDEDWGKSYSAAGFDAASRLDMVVQCTSHMQHHIGQMIYLGYEWRRKSSAT